MNGKIPSAITGIKLNRATFSDVPINGLTFINFFYGNNGAGKSSIAHAIEEGDGITWADGKTAADFDVLVYNQAYINRNFISFGDLPGVFIFGEEDIEAKKRIEQLSEERKHKSDERAAALDEHGKKKAGLDTALVEFQDKCFSCTAEIRKRFDKAMEGKKQKKGFAEAILAETKPTEHDLPELERLYDVAFDETARAYTEFKKAAATTYGSLPGKDLLDKVIVSSSDTPFAKFMKALGATASDWVRDGHTHYAGAAGGKCPYCQQKLPKDFETDIAACFDAQYQQDIRDLGQFQTTYARETAEIVRVLTANMADAMPSINLKAYQEKLALLGSNFEINRQRIAEKVKEPSKTISLEDTDTLLLEIGAMIDEINKLVHGWKKHLQPHAVIPASAINDFNTTVVRDTLLEVLPESPAFFPKDDVSDASLRFFTAEFIREKIFMHYRDEIPYASTVDIEAFKEGEQQVHISAVIYVERDSQKGILIGKKGSSIKRVGTEARHDIESFLGKKVFLELFVKVEKDWRKHENKLRRFGYSS